MSFDVFDAVLHFDLVLLSELFLLISFAFIFVNHIEFFITEVSVHHNVFKVLEQVDSVLRLSEPRMTGILEYCSCKEEEASELSSSHFGNFLPMFCHVWIVGKQAFEHIPADAHGNCFTIMIRTEDELRFEFHDDVILSEKTVLGKTDDLDLFLILSLDGTGILVDDVDIAFRNQAKLVEDLILSYNVLSFDIGSAIKVCEEVCLESFVSFPSIVSV